MLSYQEALSIIEEHAKPLGKVSVRLSGALGHVLAGPVKAKIPFPHFNNSAVDGFAVCGNAEKFKFKGEVPAGNTKRFSLKSGEAMAVFTGAPVPSGTQSVVMQEYAERRNGSVLLQKPAGNFENIRRRGEDFQKGETVLPEGTVLEPRHLALLAALGHSRIEITAFPKVAVLATGNELAASGQKLKRGQIYDCNTPLLEALLKQMGAAAVPFSKVYDNLAEIRKAVRAGLKQDVLIVCGGVSVGKYDYVKEALRLEGVREIFWKIDIKPGKPVFFGKKGKTLVFGLPGNPVSVHVTFEEFVKPALLKMMGKKTEGSFVEGELTRDYQNGPRVHFVRVQCRKQENGFQIEPLKGQGSHQIGTLAKADGLLRVDAHAVLKQGERVRIKMLGGVP